MSDFIVWLSGKYFNQESADHHQEGIDLMLSFQISLLYRSVKRNTKEIIANSSLSSLDGYSFLLHLDHADSFRKMELIELHNLEAPTGIEVIKRLLNKGLIEEFDDENDKRAKRVKMTDSGKKELERLKPLIEERFMHFSHTLTLQEKLNLVATMNRLIEAQG